MKKSFVVSVALSFAIQFVHAQTAGNLAPSSPPSGTIVGYQIGEQGANQRLWQKIVKVTDAYGNFTFQTNQAYVEVASGLNYPDPATGQWLPSREEVDAYPGGAIAQFGQYKVIFANNLNTAGAIDLQTPDGKELKSHVLGLGYFDSASGKSVLIAQIKDCNGQIVGSNQVIYADAFQGASASVCYTYRRGSFEQDVILQAQPPTPESFGLSSASTVLQVLTEFDAAPAPTITAITNGSAAALPDELLNFGAMRMIPGRSFVVGQNPLPGVRVGKQWLNVNDRTVLVESVPVSAITNQLNQLAMVGQASPRAGAVVGTDRRAVRTAQRAVPTSNSILNLVSTQRLLPAPKLAKATKTQMKLASLTPKTGLVLDYPIVVPVGTYYTDYTFQNGWTYYVTGEFLVGGTLTIEGGTVIKYAETNYPDGRIFPYAQFKCEAGPFNPAIITSANDNSVGDTIIGSSGTPRRYNCSALDFDVSPTFTGPVQYLQIRYAAVGLTFGDVTPTPVRDCEFTNVGDGIQNYMSGTIAVENDLFSGVSGAVLGADNYPWSVLFTAANLTVHHANNLITTNTTLRVTNSLFVLVTNISQTFTNAYNRITNSDSGVFESAPLGNEYLATNSPYRNQGTTNIDPALLTDLRQTTTYAPQDGGYPDFDTPDLGFHYPFTVESDYWLVFFDMHDVGHLSLYISSPVATAGTVTIPGLNFTTNFSLAPGALVKVDMGTNAIMFDYDAIENCGTHIIASSPVSVYALKYVGQDSAAFTCYPTSMLGTNYCLLARPSFDGTDGGSSEFAIVATTNNSHVTITPSATANLLGSIWANTFTLQQGQVYQINSGDVTNDVTGTKVISDKPIAVFAGDNVAFVPDANTLAGNPLVQEQLPVDSWGTNVVSRGFAGRLNGDSYRILAALSNTVLIVTGTVVTITWEDTNGGGGPWLVTKTNETVTNYLTAGQSCDIIVDGPAWFQANHPIQVAQFANGGNFDEIAFEGNQPPDGDPCEVLLPPAGHYLKTNIVVTLPDDSAYGHFIENYLNLIVLQSATNSTYLNTSLVSATNFVAIGTSDYYGAQIPVGPGTNTVVSSQPVGVEVYGWYWYDAYSYFGGIVK